MHQRINQTTKLQQRYGPTQSSITCNHSSNSQRFKEKTNENQKWISLKVS